MKNEIGLKIREIRKKNGLSQEELADLSTVNVRTIQRIEKNETEPRGATLNLICAALGISAEDVLDYGKVEDKGFLSMLQLSPLSYFVIPVGNIIIPLILWLTKRNKIIGVQEMGAKILNFQIIWTVAASLSFFLAFFAIVSRKTSDQIDWGTIIASLFILLNLLNIILAIVFAARAGKEKYNSYPSIIPFIK